MSFVRENWQPGAPRLICLFSSNQCQNGGGTQKWRNEGVRGGWEEARSNESKQEGEEGSSKCLIRDHWQTTEMKPRN